MEMQVADPGDLEPPSSTRNGKQCRDQSSKWRVRSRNWRPDAKSYTKGDARMRSLRKPVFLDIKRVRRSYRCKCSSETVSSRAPVVFLTLL